MRNSAAASFTRTVKAPNVVLKRRCGKDNALRIFPASSTGFCHNLKRVWRVVSVEQAFVSAGPDSGVFLA
jgi:hypothetical protein